MKYMVLFWYYTIVLFKNDSLNFNKNEKLMTCSYTFYIFSKDFDRIWSGDDLKK